MAITHSSDYLYWSKTRSVTVNLRRSAGDIAITALSQRADTDSLGITFQGVDIHADHLLWRVPSALMNSGGTDYDIEKGDNIVNGSDTWHIDAVEKKTSGSVAYQFDCLCKKAA